MTMGSSSESEDESEQWPSRPLQDMSRNASSCQRKGPSALRRAWIDPLWLLLSINVNNLDIDLKRFTHKQQFGCHVLIMIVSWDRKIIASSAFIQPPPLPLPLPLPHRLSTCCSETVMASLKTIQTTHSLHGGVVSDPK